MATTTPNYGWNVPTSADYVAQGAVAIQTLGDEIDATVFGLPSGALALISATTIGTAVSSVTVSGAFSATYDNYKIIVSGGASSVSTVVQLLLGSTVTGYQWSRLEVNTATSATTFQGVANTSSFAVVGLLDSSSIMVDVDIKTPFLEEPTMISARYASTAANGNTGVSGGTLVNTTSYTAFIVRPETGTMTGGTIRVYGYQN